MKLADGRLPHCNTPFEGERFTLVFYPLKARNKAFMKYPEEQFRKVVKDMRDRFGLILD